MKVNWEYKKREAEGLGRKGWRGEGYVSLGSRLWHHLLAVCPVKQVRGAAGRGRGPGDVYVTQTHATGWP